MRYFRCKKGLDWDGWDINPEPEMIYQDQKLFRNNSQDITISVLLDQAGTDIKKEIDDIIDQMNHDRAENFLSHWEEVTEAEYIKQQFNGDVVETPNTHTWHSTDLMNDPLRDKIFKDKKEFTDKVFIEVLPYWLQKHNNIDEAINWAKITAEKAYKQLNQE